MRDIEKKQDQPAGDDVDGLRKALDLLCVIIADLTGASSVMVAKRDPIGKKIVVKGSFGTIVRELDLSFGLPDLNIEKTPTLSVQDVRADNRFLNHPMLKIAPHIRSFVALLLPNQDEKTLDCPLIQARPVICGTMAL